MGKIIKYPYRNKRDPWPMSDLAAAHVTGRMCECNDLLAAIDSQQITTLESLRIILAERLRFNLEHLERAGVEMPHCECGVLSDNPCVECIGGVRAYFNPD